MVLRGTGRGEISRVATPADRHPRGKGDPAPHATIGPSHLAAIVSEGGIPRILASAYPDIDERGLNERTLPQVLRAYVSLTKPRIVVLLLVTTVPAMILAARGIPSPWLLAATLFGGSLSAGGANAINHYLDRDIDRAMARTRRRPVPAGQILPGNALTFGLLLGALGSAWLAVTVNLLAASLAVSAIGFYVLVYTVWLKRRSPLNIVIGGAAGGVPVLVGWAAVTGRVGLPAWVLFGIVFLWTPPHFWALSIRCETDYRNAGVPMLPVVAGRDRTARQIWRYAAALVAVSLVLVPVAGMGSLYLVSALVLGGALLWPAARLRQSVTNIEAARLFRRSILYLGLLFVAVALDEVLRFVLRG